MSKVPPAPPAPWTRDAHEPLAVDRLARKVVDLRQGLIDVAYSTGGAYLAQALSGIDMMAALHYRYAAGNGGVPDAPDRDRFLLSPGHYALALYAILADRGYFDPAILGTFKDDGSPAELATHKGTLPGVEVSGGSLGQVLSLGVGMALHARLRGAPQRIFVMMSDGEQDEGQIWEAAASAAHYRLSNLVAVIDVNGFQVDGPTAEVMDMEPLGDKYRAFGWDVEECDGNDLVAVCASLDRLVAPGRERPGILVGRTVRGKGVSFMEAHPGYHYARLDGSLADRAKAELAADTDAV